MSELMEFLADVESYNIDVTMADTSCWGRKDTFALKECYNKIPSSWQLAVEIDLEDKVTSYIVCF